MDQWTTLIMAQVLVCHLIPTTWRGHRSLVNDIPIRILTLVHQCIQTIPWMSTDVLTLIHISGLHHRCTQGHPWMSQIMALSLTHRCLVHLSPRQSMIVAYHHHRYTQNAPRSTLACRLQVCRRQVCHHLAYLHLAYLHLESPLPAYHPLEYHHLQYHRLEYHHLEYLRQEYHPLVCPLRHFMSMGLLPLGSMAPWTPTLDLTLITSPRLRSKVSLSQR